MIKFTASSVLRSPRRFAMAAGLGLTACVLATASPALAVVTPLPVAAPSPVGDASQQPSNNANGPSAGVTVPGGGTTQFLITTESVSGDGSTVSGTSAVPVTTLANASYLDPAQVAFNSNNSGTEGSALVFTLNVQPGHSAVQFNFDFATAEDVGQPDAHPDFAYYSITPVDSNGIATGATTAGFLGSAADALSKFTALNDPNLDSPFNVAESYNTFTSANLATGRYVLAIGVADADTTDTQSGLFVSNVVTVPEPGVQAMLLLAGGAGVVWAMRRRVARAEA